MKFPALLMLAFAMLPAAVRAQAIHFEKDSLTQVFAKARQQNKPVFVLMTGPPPSANLPSALRKARGEAGLNSPAVSAALNKDCLNKEVAFGSAESAEVGRPRFCGRSTTRPGAFTKLVPAIASTYGVPPSGVSAPSRSTPFPTTTLPWLTCSIICGSSTRPKPCSSKPWPPLARKKPSPWPMRWNWKK